MKRWFGFTQGGCIVFLGEHDSIEGADTPETGGATCTWIWDEEALRLLKSEIEEELK